MDHSLFGEADFLVARAICLGQRIDLRRLERTKRLADAPLMVSVGERGAAVLYRYGVVVLFGLDPMEEANWLAGLEQYASGLFSEPQTEELELRRSAEGEERWKDGTLQLAAFDTERLQLVADILAKSVVLAHYELSISKHFDRIEPLAVSLQKGAPGKRPQKELLAHIGDVLAIHAEMVGRVEVREKPELLWDAPQLGRLYAKLEDEYELSERHIALERKLELISRTATTLLELVQNQRTLRVEWYIVFLIVMEIVINLVEKFYY